MKYALTDIIEISLVVLIAIETMDDGRRQNR